MADRTCARDGCNAPLTGLRADAAYCSRACNQAARRARKSTQRVHARRAPRSGLQVSYRKAIRILAPELGHARAETLLAQALPDAQRARIQPPAPHTRIS